MTTPPTPPPPGPGEPYDPWAPPAGPAAGPVGGPPRPGNDLYGPPGPGDPFSAYPTGPAPHHQQQPGWEPYGVPQPMLPVAPHRSSRAGVLIVAGLAVLMLVLGGAVVWYVGKGDLKLGSGVATSSFPSAAPTTTTTTTKPKPFAEIGDCVNMTGGSFSPSYEKVPCTENRHNYTVSKVPATGTEKCAEVEDGYIKYTKGASTTVCLIPVFVDGECYDFTLASLQAEFPKKACGGYMVVKAKVLANTVDKAACGQDERLALALAYPEIKTTYCLTHTFQIG
ncbi:hypothetical protein ACIA8G_31055 [Lentzea sp. NPDC051213]|uniref:LppU/SCO3897 family protein n=1 Tax=Lentzea sp. NPDC051213 TaxID=3364126 RepID=UPI00379E3922